MKAIGTYAELAHIQCYSPTRVAQLFESARGEAIEHYCLADMEQVRTGRRGGSLRKTMNGSGVLSALYDARSSRKRSEGAGEIMRYAWDADSYEKYSSPQHQWALDLIHTLTFAGDERVLDIGCGDGKISAELAAHVPGGSVLGIDAAPTMIQFACDKFPPSRFPNLRFQLGDATHLTFRDEFDLVVSFAALHWVHDHRVVLRGVKRALKPGGSAVLQFGGEGNAATLLAVTHAPTTREQWRRYFVGFTVPWVFYGVSPYRDLINKVGLSAKRVELVPKDVVFREKDALKAWCSTVFLPCLERLPEAQRDTFAEEVAVLHLERQPHDKRGVIHVPMVRLEVEVTRSS